MQDVAWSTLPVLPIPMNVLCEVIGLTAASMFLKLPEMVRLTYVVVQDDLYAVAAFEVGAYVANWARPEALTTPYLNYSLAISLFGI